MQNFLRIFGDTMIHVSTLTLGQKRLWGHSLLDFLEDYNQNNWHKHTHILSPQFIHIPNIISPPNTPNLEEGVILSDFTIDLIIADKARF